MSQVFPSLTSKCKQTSSEVSAVGYIGSLGLEVDSPTLTA